MIRKSYKRFKSVTKSSKTEYIKYCKLPVDEKLVLLEGGQGSNINGNMFAMLQELCRNARWSDYKPAFVVTKKTMEKAQHRMEVYGFTNVLLTVRGSKEYCKLLATAKYIMTDNSFPPYFNKRDDQVFLNTWHGTPLKTLGKANKSSLASLANVQKNYLMSDYALFPNEFTREVFMRDYDLRPIFKYKSFVGNYPRNYIFYDDEAGAKMKLRLGYAGKKLYAYMPTWRDANSAAQKRAQINKTREILEEFDQKLDDDTVLLVNLHFLLSTEINCEDYKHIEYFSPDYDTYEILNACDGLITDYSSVFFDFAVSRKKVILYAYDKEKYLSTRGLYMPFESLPFPIVETVDEVVEFFNKDIPVPQEFLDEFCTRGWADSCERLFDMMVTGETASYRLESNNIEEDKLCLLYCGKLIGNCYSAIKTYMNQNPGYKYVIAYRRNLTQFKKDKITELGDNVSVYGLLNAYQFKYKELFLYIFAVIFNVFNFTSLKRFFRRERDRLFGNIEPALVVDFAHNSGLTTGVLSSFDCPKEAVYHSGFFGGRGSKYAQRIIDAFGFKKVDNIEAEKEFIANLEDEDLKVAVHKSYTRAKNITPFYYNSGKKMKYFSSFKFKAPIELSLDDIYITVGDKRYKPKFYCKNKKSFVHKGMYSLSIPVEDVVTLPAKSRVGFSYDGLGGAKVENNIKYFTLLRKKFMGLRGPMIKHEETNTVAVFRQTIKNDLIIYVRSFNVTDKIIERIKQVVAFGLSLLWNSKKAKKLVLLYEKNSEKYEESASVLYEELLEMGYNNAYFLVDKEYEYIDRIPEKYRANIIYKYSFKHYLYFFKSKTFIGTEAIVHSFDLKTFNPLPLWKISRKDLNYVFLQHGVMYMVSLDSESRKMFKRKKLKGAYRVVVSSQAEADHFTTLGRHYEEDIYISGLPKFDRNTLNDDADKIVIMPTWRPWEINEARDDFSETPYFKMLMKLYDNVPDELKENVIILPHPLIVNELSKASPSVVDKIVLNARYDDILKQARLLITDYSSIAFDAFYRGSRVIFYWEEKDYCMEQYGPTTKLMLNEENVYGDYFYSIDGLTEAIAENYNNPQTEEYKERYGKLVDFHDGKNTQRLIEFLKQDEII